MSDPSAVFWSWDFGDGGHSTDQFPVHVYKLPGKYTVTLTVTDDSGTIYTHSKILYIYTYEYPNTLRRGPTDYCIRHAVKSSQGVGVTPFGGRWAWPMPVGSTARVIEPGNKRRHHGNISSRNSRVMA
jgi:PKD repeat protein